MQAEEHVERCLFFSLFAYQFCSDLMLTSCFPQIRMEVASHADSPYIARDKKSFWKYSIVEHSLSCYPRVGLQTY